MVTAGVLALEKSEERQSARAERPGYRRLQDFLAPWRAGTDRHGGHGQQSVACGGPLFSFAQRARCAAAIRRRALADIIRFLGVVTTLALPLRPFTFAQRARWAAAILALPAEDIRRRVAVPFVYAAPKADSAAPIAFISLLNRACSFLNISTTLPRLVI